MGWNKAMEGTPPWLLSMHFENLKQTEMSGWLPSKIFEFKLIMGWYRVDGWGAIAVRGRATLEGSILYRSLPVCFLNPIFSSLNLAASSTLLGRSVNASGFAKCQFIEEKDNMASPAIAIF